MTPRQQNLKLEIFEIADDLQLGIANDEKDWFFEFIKKMDYSVKVDSITKVSGWSKLDRYNDLSLDFIREFQHRFDWKLNWLNNKNKLPITEVLPNVDEGYIMTWDWYLLNKIAQSDELTDDIVRQFEKTFDQTCEDRKRNGAPAGSDYTAWYYISNNPKVSESVRQFAKGKMQFNK